MELLSLTIALVLCALSQAFTLSTVATVSLALFALNKPVFCVFGVFRRRSAPIQEAIVLEPESPFSFYNQPMTSGFNPYMFGSGGYLLPAFGAPAFGMFGVNRFPPRMPETRPIRTSHPKREVPSEMLPAPSVPDQAQMSEASFDEEYEIYREFFANMSAEDIERYFSLVAEADEKTCCAKLICEIGASPRSEGVVGQLITDMLRSRLEFPDDSKTALYRDVFTHGMVEGLSICDSSFPMCDEETYEYTRSQFGLEKKSAVPREEFTESTL